jgi:exodeoxyribonuclease-3
MRFRIASWNVNSLRVRLAHVLAWLQEHQPDVLALQETKTPDKDFPSEALEALGYHIQKHGQRTYNGVATLSRHPFSSEMITQFPDDDDPQCRLLSTTVLGITINNIYLPNGASYDSDKYTYKKQWLKKLHAFLKKARHENKQSIVLGDFNIAPTDDDVHDPDLWQGSVLTSAEVRQAFQALLSLGYHDTFQAFRAQQDTVFSWWDYRQAAFRRNRGLRIDHILASTALNCTLSCIDKTPRSLERPSDHAPVMAEFELAES